MEAEVQNTEETGAHLNEDLAATEAVEGAPAEIEGPVVIISGLGSGNIGIILTEEAKELVRYRFNPSGLHSVEHVKLLAAALATVLKVVQNQNPKGGREAAVALTHLQTASMFGVAAATAGL